MSDIFEEAKEDARIEQIINFWRQYGKSIIVAILILLAGLLAYYFYDASQRSARERQAHLYQLFVAELEQGKSDTLQQSLQKLMDESAHGYAVLAQLRLAAEDFKTTGVVATDIYEKVWQNKKVDEKIRDLAVIMWALQGLDVLDPEKMAQLLEPIAASNRIYNVLATEVMAYVFLREGKTQEAQQILMNLVENKGVSSGIKMRARAMLTRISAS